jgi:thiol-disulfide isomerase/thioredoxin
MPRPAAASVAVAALATVLLAGCSSPFSASESSGGFVSGDGAITVLPPDEREPLAEISGETLEGEQLSTDDYAGQVMVLNVWGSWCAPCRTEAPALEEVSSQLAADGVQFVGINIRDQRTSAQGFQERQGTSYPSLYDPDSSTLLELPDGLYPVATPTTYVVDAQGRVAARVLDATTASTLAGLVEDVLAEEGA